MTVRISVIFACRVSGNTNSRLANMMRSLTERLSDKRLVEVLVRFDDDDKDAPAAIELLRSYSDRLDIRTFTGARGAGYSDLHKMYYDTFLQISPTSEVVWIITDDIEIFFLDPQGCWDEYVIQELDRRKNPIFMFHIYAQVRPYHERSFAQTVDSPDSYPMWSRQWLIAQGSLGPVYAVDSWAAVVTRHLKLHYGFDQRIHLPHLSLHRHMAETDGAGNERYDVLRHQTHQFLQSDFAQQMIAANARSIVAAYHSFSMPGRIFRLVFIPLPFVLSVYYRIRRRAIILVNIIMSGALHHMRKLRHYIRTLISG